MVDVLAAYSSDDLLTVVGHAAPASDQSALDVSELHNAASADILVGAGSISGSNAPLILGPELTPDTTRLPSGVRVLLGFRAPAVDRFDRWIEFIAVWQPDTGDVRFIGDCAERFESDPLVAYRDEVRPDDRLDDLLVAILSDDAVWEGFRAWQTRGGASAAPTFDELEPDERQLDPEFTPAHVLAPLRRFTIELTFPASWRGIPGAAVCSFVPLGWNECVALEASDEPTISLLGYRSDSDSVQLWMIDYQGAGLRSPIAFLCEVDMRSGEDGAVQVTISDRSNGSTFEAIVAGVQDGTITLSVG